MKQCFYLVASIDCNLQVHPEKIFLQEFEAIKYGRVLASKKENVILYKQEITRSAKIEFVQTLSPYKTTKQ